MAPGEGYHKPPLFDGTDFVFWKRRMEIYMGSLGFDVWAAVEIGYTPHDTVTPSATDKKNFENNRKALNVIQGGLTNSELSKVMDCKTAKEVWDRLINIYEGDKKIKKVKLQTFRAQFENLKMNEDETIDQYMNRVNEVVNSIRGLGEDLKDSVICQKILRSLTSKFESKVSALEETNDLDEVTIDEIHGALTASEMRIDPGTTVDKQVAFKAMKKLKMSEKPNEEESEDDAIAHFTRKLKKGTGKYKNKLPFKCFNYGKVGHFTAKCPKKSKLDSDDEDESKYKFKAKKNYSLKKNKSNRRSFISKRVSNKGEEFTTKILDESKFVNSISSGDEERNNEDKCSSSDEEGEINFEEEFIAAIKELKKERKNNKLISQEVKKQKQVIQELKAQYEESKKAIENLNTQLKLLHGVECECKFESST
ncbi:hypothetical protein NE237_008470 [Protea cynaroides]|uniref:CCHC-type domain-containing protein n=1 Tax=Protea cynaroides TaxID=273540 RepID=A0A9Q0KVU9_9MAGN|nr:hypothetical protein NE237_008470 [Protea cynaroides]